MANTLKLGAGKWATGKDTVLAFNDENNNFKPLPFSFSRASKATVVNQSGLIETVGSGEPRIDFKDNTKGALLLEPSRTNAIRWSDLFSASSTGGYYGLYWNAIITDNNTISPDGSLNASKVVRGTDDVLIRALNVVTASTANTTTLWAKKGNYDKIIIDIGDEAASTITLTDEWQRIETTTSSALNTHIDISMPNSASGDYIYIYGFQAEQGSYATSYIPTSGSAVTRSIDTCIKTVPEGIVNENEMTLYCELEYIGGINIIAMSVHNNSNSVIWLNIEADLTVTGANFYGGFYGVSRSKTSLELNNKYKIAYRTKNGDSALYINGILEASSTETIANPNILNKVQLGSFWTSANTEGNFKIIDAKCYNSGLSNSELAALTQ